MRVPRRSYVAPIQRSIIAGFLLACLALFNPIGLILRALPRYCRNNGAWHNFRKTLFGSLNALTVLSLLLNLVLPIVSSTGTATASTLPTSQPSLITVAQNHPVNSVLVSSPPVAAALSLPQPGINSPVVDPAKIKDALRNVSTMFVENVGQFPAGTKYQVKAWGGTLNLADDALWLTLNSASTHSTSHDNSSTSSPFDEIAPLGVTLKLTFEGANPAARLEPFRRLETHVSYFIGNDPAQWHVDVPAWGGVRYVNLYPGVDLELSNAGMLPQLIAHPGADLSQVRLHVDGADALFLQDGMLHISSSSGEFAMPLLELGGLEASAPIHPSIQGTTVSAPFAPASHSPNKPAASSLGTEDGGGSFVYGTFLGGSQYDEGWAIALDAQNNVYIAGNTASSNFPVTTGTFGGGTCTSYYGGCSDLFIAKLDLTKPQILYATFIGGSGNDMTRGIAIDQSGAAYVTGVTASSNFPTTVGAFRTSLGILTGDVFATKLSSSGTSLVYSTFLGADQCFGGHGIAVDSNGSAYVTGSTSQSLFPTTSGAYNRTLHGTSDVFIVKLNSSGSGEQYSTFLGGSAADSGNGIKVDASGIIYVTGSTSSTNFPTTTGSYATTNAGGSDAFVIKLNPAGGGTSDLLYGSYLGGVSDDIGNSIALDASGFVYITGQTNSTGFPTTSSPFSAVNNGNLEAFVSKLKLSALSTSDLVYSTFFGGTGMDMGLDIAVDRIGMIYVAGETASTDLPTTTDAVSRNFSQGEDCGGPCGNDAFVVKLDPTQVYTAALQYSTYLGGYNFDGAAGLALDATGTAYVTGHTTSPDFPTTQDALQPAFNGPDGSSLADMFLSVLAIGLPQPQDPCPICTQARKAVVDVRTGTESYQVADISLPALGGTLQFQRWYASSMTAVYTTTTGFGWTDNLDTRLILPGSTGGVTGTILAKLDSANRYVFFINGDGSYTPYPGVLVRLGATTVPTTGYVVTSTDQSTYHFDSNGRALSWSDAQNHTWTYSYDGNGRLTALQDSTGQRYLAIAYDGQGRVSSVSDPVSRTVRYGYDGNGDLTTVVDTQGYTSTYVYSGTTHLLSQIVNPLSQTETRTDYDVQGRAIRQFNALGNKTFEATYNVDNSRVITDALGNPTTYVYTGRGTLAKTTDAIGQATHTTSDGNFRIVRVTDPNGSSDQAVWSADGINVLRMTNPLVSSTHQSFDNLNNLTLQSDGLGHSRVNSYAGTLLTQTTDALSNTTLYTYTNGFLTAQTDALGNLTQYGYNAFGQRTSMTDTLAHVSRFDFDAIGRLITTTDPIGRMNVDKFDNANHLIQRTQNYTSSNSIPNFLNQYNLVTQYGFDQAGRPILITDTVGRLTLNEFDARSRLVKTTHNLWVGQAQNYQSTFNLVTQYGYNNLGSQILVTDTFGRVDKTDYDALNRPYQVTQNYLAGQPQNYQNQYNLISQNNYLANGNLSWRMDTLGRTSRYSYDAANQPITVTVNLGDGVYDPNRPDEDLNTISTYDVLGNVVSITDPMGRVIKTEYDALNHPITVTQNYLAGQPHNYQNQYNVITQYAYDVVGNRVLVTDTVGQVSKTDYDSLNRPFRTTQNALASQPQNYLNQYNLVTAYGFDMVGRQVVLTDTLGRAAYTEYDALNRVTSQIDFAGQRNGNGYDALSNRIVVTDTLANSTAFAYDTLNRVITTTRPLGQVTTDQYDALGSHIRTIDPRGNGTQYGYDSLNRSIAITDTNLQVTRVSYDAASRRTAQTDPLGHSLSFGYDQADRQITTTNALNQSFRYGYDGAGNRTVMTDSQGIVTRFGFDALDHMISVIENYVPGHSNDNQTNVTTSYGYDVLGNRTVITDAVGHISTFGYDSLKRELSETDALSHTVNYGYDAANRRIQLTDAKGQITQYGYTVLDRLASITYQADGTVTQLAYDAVGNRTVMTDSVGVTQYVYDALYRLTQVTDPFTQSVAYAYDLANNRTQLYYPGGKVVTYTYSILNQLAGLTDWSGNSTSYTYDNAGRLITTTLPSNIRSVSSYDNADRLTRLSHVRISDSALLGDYQYTLDWMGNRVGITETLTAPGGGPFGPTMDLSYKVFLPVVTGGVSNKVFKVVNPFETPWPENLTATPTGTPTTTATPTNTPTPTSTAAQTNTPTDTPTVVWTATAALTDPALPTAISTSTRTSTATSVPTPPTTPTHIATATALATAAPTGTLIPTLAPTSVKQNTTSPTPTSTPPAGSFPISLDFSHFTADQRAERDSSLYYNPNVPPQHAVLQSSLNHIVISEFRTRGTGGTSDEFVELYNPTNAAVNIGGWLIKASTSTGSISTLVTINTGTILQPGRHFLAGQTSYSGSVARDQTYSGTLADNGGIGLLNGATIVDQVGLNSGSAYKEGTTLTPLTTNVNRGYERKVGGTSGHCTDANANSTDFQLITPSNPQNMASAATFCPGSATATATNTPTNTPTSTNTPTNTPTATPTPSTVVVRSAWTTDNSGVTKTLFQPSDGIRYYADIYNTTGSSQTAHFDWERRGPCGYTNSFQYDDTALTGSWFLYMPDTIASNACEGIYTHTVNLTYSGITTTKSSTFTVTLPQPPSGNYTYDPLYRLTGAVSKGSALTYTFGYAYDAVGNRTVQTRTITSTAVSNYVYDNANHLTSINGQSNTWDNNGNLLNDGASLYAYDQANRLKTLTQTATVYSFGYNGVGDRLKQVIAGSLTTYTLDLNSGLTQVLVDGGNRYVYGNSRVAQYAGTNASYFLADGLGSVRQLADTTGLVTLAERYDPFGALLSSVGSGTSEFGFAGEQADATGLEYLRARYYAPGQGRFTSKDAWVGDVGHPMSSNSWLYVYANPVNLTDPSGLLSFA